jgi:hypothetical protein
MCVQIRLQGALFFTARGASASLTASILLLTFQFLHGDLKMKRLVFAAAVAIAALSYTTSLQAQTSGQPTNGSTKIGKKSAGAPKQANLPRCTRARQMAGTPCSGG